MKKLLAILLIVLLLVLCFCGCARAERTDYNRGIDESSIETTAANDKEKPIQAQVINVLEYSGAVAVLSGGVEMSAYSGMRLSAGDKLTTGANSNAVLDLNNGGMVMVERNSELEITQSVKDYIEITLLSGSIINDIKEGSGSYTVKANNVTMGVLGTVFRVSIEDATGAAVTDLYEGKMLVTFTTSSGQERAFVLQPGRRFTGTQDNIDGSDSLDELITEDIYLDDLSPDLLDMLREALEERAEDEGVQEVLDMIDALEREREEEETPPSPTPTPARFVPIVPVTPDPTPTPTPAPTTPKLTAKAPQITGSSVVLSWTPNTTGFKFGYFWEEVLGFLNPTEEAAEKVVIGGKTYYISNDNSVTVAINEDVKESLTAGAGKVNVALIDMTDLSAPKKVTEGSGTITLPTATAVVTPNEDTGESTAEIEMTSPPTDANVKYTGEVPGSDDEVIDLNSGNGYQDTVTVPPDFSLEGVELTPNDGAPIASGSASGSNCTVVIHTDVVLTVEMSAGSASLPSEPTPVPPPSEPTPPSPEPASPEPTPASPSPETEG